MSSACGNVSVIHSGRMPVKCWWSCRRCLSNRSTEYQTRTKTVNIISILPAKVAVDNAQNKRNAQAFGALIGAVAGGVIGHNVGSGSNSGTTAGAVGGGAVGAAAGSMVNDKTLVEGVSLTYKEGTKVYTSTQVGKECQFTTGLAVVITTTYNETRIQPNTKCPEKS